MGIIAGLAFVFSFGNVWALALRLGVPGPIAPLIAPMVDLSVVGLLVALRYLSLHGVPVEQIKGATRLMHLSGLLTLVLNVAEPIVAGHYGRAGLAVPSSAGIGWRRETSGRAAAAILSSPRRTALRSSRATSTAPSPSCATRQGSGASAFMTSGTPARPCSTSRGPTPE